MYVQLSTPIHAYVEAKEEQQTLHEDYRWLSASQDELKSPWRQLLGTPVEVTYSSLVSRYTMPRQGWKTFPYGWQYNSLGMDPGQCKQEKSSSAP